MSAPARAPAARVLCCITRPHPAAAEALGGWAPQAEIAGVRGEDTAYWREIRSRWAGERDLVIIEQDIGIGEGTVASLEGCGEDWCCYAYPVFARGIRLTMGLGCTKISAALQRKVPPEVVEQAFAACDGCEGRGCWWHLDRHVSECLRQAGFAPHVHGDVTHHHAYDLRSYLWPPLYAGDRSAAEVFGDDRPPRDVPAIGPLTPGEAAAFAAELLARGQEAVAAQAPLMDGAALDGGGDPAGRELGSARAVPHRQGEPGVHGRLPPDRRGPGPGRAGVRAGRAGRRVAGHLAGPVPGGHRRRGGRRPVHALAGRDRQGHREPGRPGPAPACCASTRPSGT